MLKYKELEVKVNNMTKENIYFVTQSVIAVMMVLGTGVGLFAGIDNAEMLVGLAGTVVGYYFINLPKPENKPENKPELE